MHWLGKGRTKCPAVRLGVVDLDRVNVDERRRIAAEDVDLAVQFGDCDLSVGGKKGSEVNPDAGSRLQARRRRAKGRSAGKRR